MLLLSLLLSCEPGPEVEEGECLPVDERVHVAACVVPAGAVPAEVEVDEVRDLVLDGARVVEAGSGAPPEGCRSFHGWKGGGEPELGTSETAWVTLEDGEGAAWTVALSAGGPLPALSDYDALDLRWSQDDLSPFAGEYGAVALTLTESASGALVAWMEQGPMLDGMDLPPGVEAARGDEECRAAQECGTDVWYRADLSVDGEAVTLRPGGSAIVEGWVVSFEGEREVQDLECSETSGGEAGLAIVTG